MARPFNTHDYSPEELLKEFEDFKKYCKENAVSFIENGKEKVVERPLSVSGFVCWLGKGKNYLNQLKENKDYSGILDSIYSQIENSIEIGGMCGMYNSGITTRNLSANFDWRDKTDNKNNNTGEMTFKVLL